MSNDKRDKISDYQPQQRNANKHNQRGMGLLQKSIETDGFIGAMTAANDGEIIAGSARLEKSAEVYGIEAEPIVIETDGTRPIIVKRTDIQDANEPRAKRLSIADNRVQEIDLEWDTDVLQGLNDFDEIDLGDWWNEKELTDLGIDLDEPPAAPEPDLDRAEELREKWGVELGQLWRLGDHRLICGDCTDKTVVERVMGGEKAVMLHADPPYGMGKEKDGIANDNLYREKLDAFQMQWWIACRPALEDNASAYIWGNAPDLWRLWYVGGLRDSERLTMRNEIIWGKESAQGSNSDAHRMYPNGSERCLFFMIGEQGFSTNADNYWDTWDTIREYLKEQRDLMGWSIEDTKIIAGHSPTSGCHWFDRSQWTMPTREVYEAWQDAANNNGFKREYDELKREYYATRAYFDNTHDLMTDVWNFLRVKGEDRYGHATPKPVEMMERTIMSSAPEGAAVLVPFNGTAPELIACERLKRKCRAVEISPAYVAVALERWAEMTGETPELIHEE